MSDRPSVKRRSSMRVIPPPPPTPRPRMDPAALESLIGSVAAKTEAIERLVTQLAKDTPTSETLEFVFRTSQQGISTLSRDLAAFRDETRATLAEILSRLPVPPSAPPPTQPEQTTS